MLLLRLLLFCIFCCQLSDCSQAMEPFLPLCPILSPFCEHVETLPGAGLQTSAELTKRIHNHCPARETEKKHITVQGGKSMGKGKQPANGSTKEGRLTYLARLGRRSNQGRLHGGGDNLCCVMRGEWSYLDNLGRREHLYPNASAK